MISPVPACNVAVVIVNYRTSELAASCLESLRRERAAMPGLRVIVVDGGSADGSVERLLEVASRADFSDWVEILPLEINGGFGWANNQAIVRLLTAPGPPDFIHLLNPDTVVEAGAVSALAENLMAHPGAAAAGSQLLEDDGTPAGSAFRRLTVLAGFSRGARTGLIDRIFRVRPIAFPVLSESIEVDWVTGASVMLRAEALREVGLFDDGFFLYHEEIELMWRMRKAGWKIRHEPRSRVRHLGGAATGVHSRRTSLSPVRRRPAYWYQSRRRLFALTQGRAAAALANLCWIGGHAIAVLRRALGAGRKSQPTAHELFDHVRHGFPWRREVRSPFTAWDSPRTETPAWMNERD